MSFSERHGHKEIRDTVQIESMDEPLRNGLWNVLYEFCLKNNYNNILYVFLECVWTDYFKERVDGYDLKNTENMLEYYFFECKWDEVYCFIEFTRNNYSSFYGQEEGFANKCNVILKRERAGYRFVNNLITPIINEEEIQSIEIATNCNHSTVSNHINSALEMLSNREKTEYRKSIAESIHAVESLANIVTGNKGKTLGKLTKDLNIDPAFKRALDSIYGYASNEARHGAKEMEIDKTFDDAKFMLVTCSAFINLIEAKSSNHSN